MDSLPCDVVILPSPVLAGMAIDASIKLDGYDSFFVLKDGEYFPHASLYMLQLKTQDLPQVEKILSEIAWSTAPLQLKSNHYDSADGFIDVEYEKSPDLVALQAAVIQALNPIRDGMRKKDIARMQEAEGLVLKNLQDYGYRFAGELFRPHMTLSRLKIDTTDALKTIGEPQNFNGAFMQLGLFEMGDNGTCIRKLMTFDFLQ